MTLTLPRSLVDEMVAHARADLPNECCGIIAQAADDALTLYRTTNAEASPWRFNIPAQQLLHLYNAIEGADGEMLVIYHSHTMSAARPSPTDLNIARLHHGPASLALLGARLAEGPGAVGPRLADRRRPLTLTPSSPTRSSWRSTTGRRGVSSLSCSSSRAARESPRARALSHAWIIA